MANLFFDLPLPVLNGPGASVDVSGMGSPKTVVVEGELSDSIITIEVSTDGGVAFAPIVTFQGTQSKTFECAAQFMRANVSGRKANLPFSANVDVGGNDAGALFAALPMPAGDGPGAAVDISALGSLKTFVPGGSYSGCQIIVEISEDGASYGPLVGFREAASQQTLVTTARFARVNVSGRRSPVPFTATMSVGGVNAPSGGGGSANAQRFQYTVTGLEADRSELTIPLPAARADALYLVTPSQEQVTNQVTMNVQTASKTVNNFVLSLSGQATAGDIFTFIVDDPT